MDKLNLTKERVEDFKRGEVGRKIEREIAEDWIVMRAEIVRLKEAIATNIERKCVRDKMLNKED
jgi:hypothetical protein